MNKSLILLFLCMVTFCFSQKKSDPLPEDIEYAKTLKTKFEKDDIVILESDERISFRLNEKTSKVEVLHRTKEQYMNISKRSDIQKFITYDGESEVRDFDVQYQNKKSTNFQVIDEPISEEDMFHHDMRVKYVNLDFPVQGYQYYFESLEKTKDIKYYTSLYFTGVYQTLNKKVTFEIPDWLTLELKEYNFEGFDIVKTEVYDADKKLKTLTFDMKSIKGMYDENNAPGPSHIYPHVLVLAKSYRNKKWKRPLFNETKDLYNWYKYLVNSTKEQPDLLRGKVEELIKGIASDEEKIKNIYYWVQDNIRYIAFEDGIAGFQPDESQNVFQKRYGDCKGMANLTKQMLKIAGFDARLTWVGTKRIVYDYATPNLSVDNHMICTLIKDGEKIYLDGTEKYNSYKEYAERIQGKQVLIENGDDYILSTIPNSVAKKNEQAYTFKASINEDALEGEVAMVFEGESQSSILYSLDATKDKNESLAEYFKYDDSNLQITNLKTSDIEDRDANLKIDYNLKINNAVSSFGNEVYVELDYRKEFGRLLLKDRKLDYVFSYKKRLVTVIELTIPENLMLTNIPDNLHSVTDDFKIDIVFEEKANKIVCTKIFTIHNAKLKVVNFDQWNEAVNELKNIYNHQLIFLKK